MKQIKINDLINYILNIFVNYDSLSPRLTAKILKSIINTLRKTKDPDIINECWKILDNLITNLPNVLFQDIDELTMLSLLDSLVILQQMTEERVLEEDPLGNLNINPNFLEEFKSDNQ